MNVLVTSAGRRVELVRAFQASARSVDPAIRVFAADARPDLSSACQVADGWLPLPRVADDGYLEALIAACQQHAVGVIVPTIDHELIPLATAADQLAAHGVTVSLPDTSIVRQCRDKTQTQDLLEPFGLKFPRAVSPDNLTFPVFAKPRDGSSSLGIATVESEADLRPEYLQSDRYLLQEFIDPAEFQEITVDMYFDRESRLRCVIPRLRIETRAGEVSKGLTVRDSLYTLLSERFAAWPGVRGVITMQVFATSDRSVIKVIEVNPRFGGGYPLTHQAGAHFTEWIVREYLRDESIEWFTDWKSDQLMLRYDSAVFIDQPHRH